MRRLAPPAILLALIAACDGTSSSSDSLAIACTCDDGARNGFMTCPLPGAGCTCDCTETACAPAASRVCEGEYLYDVDACGNREPVPAQWCACHCVAGATACPDWQEPAALTPPSSCTVATDCLQVDDFDCEQVGDEWRHGFALTNACDFAIRCYFYSFSSTIVRRPDGYWAAATYSCLAPPAQPKLDSGQSSGFAGQFFSTEAECRLSWDSPAVVTLSYRACVAADDPADTCLPDVSYPDGVCPPPTLVPVCGGG
jgi:hypothetical protein